MCRYNRRRFKMFEKKKQQQQPIARIFCYVTQEITINLCLPANLENLKKKLENFNKSLIDLLKFKNETLYRSIPHPCVKIK